MLAPENTIHKYSYMDHSVSQEYYDYFKGSPRKPIAPNLVVTESTSQSHFVELYTIAWKKGKMKQAKGLSGEFCLRKQAELAWGTST